MSAPGSTVVVFHNPDKPAARRELPRLKAWFRRRGFVAVGPAACGRADWAVALGGDGTLLRAARCLAPYGIPVVGVNLGRLGFLAATDLKHMYRTLDAVSRGKLPVSTRTMLAVKPPRNREQRALNDCVVRVIGSPRAARLSVQVDGQYLGTYFGDGLILSTPTGSTAYSLAASGPIVDPEMDLMLLTPICPHSLTQRPFILPPGAAAEIRVEESSRDALVLSLDGQVDFPLKVGDRVLVHRAAERFQLFADPGRPYFSLLREKLKWGER
jgi:NAD+ kinase